MPRDITPGAEAAALNDRFRHRGAWDVLQAVVADGVVGRVALVSSFGAEAVALLHLAAMVRRDVPVLFIDTEMLFTETLVYQQELAERLDLRNLTILRGSGLSARDPDGRLHRRDPDACCALRKTAPLARALQGFDGWITGRKRYQSESRATLEHFERDPRSGRIKVNPLAHWSARDVQDYIAENRLPRHPLVARGYPSIGCAPCTAPADAAAPRSGRWRGTDKTECGIHLDGGRLTRTQ